MQQICTAYFEVLNRKRPGDIRVPAVALARVAKQNMLCTAHASWMGDMLLTLAHAQTMSGWLLQVEAVLARWRRIWPLSVAVDLGKWALIKLVVRPGMVFTLVLLVRASRSVAAVREQSS